jgi:LCP family protein required for cell wall assembly
VKRLAVASVCCVVFTSGGIGAAYWFANDKWDNVNVVSIPSNAFASPTKGKSTNFLIIGSDTRADLTNPSDVQTFGGDQGPPRGDTIMIANVDPAHDTGMLVSFPRDIWVRVPGHGMQKINAALNDGPAKVIETLKDNFGIPIHHFIDIDIARFRELIDAIGTVPMYFPTAARDRETGLDITRPGCYHFTGSDAVAYVRSREYEYRDARTGQWKKDPTADLGRIKRQQYFIRALAQVAIDTAAKHPFKLDAILNNVFATLHKDRNLGLSDVRTLAAAFRSTDPASIGMYTVPTMTQKLFGQNQLVVDQVRAAAVLNQLRYLGPKPKPLPVPTDVKPNQIKVKVLNGGGVKGQAKTTLDALAFAGFRPVTPAENADRSDYSNTEVRYVKGALHKAQLVAAYLGLGKLVVAKTVKGVDVTVVIGEDFKRVAAPSTTAAPTTTTRPTATSAPHATTTTVKTQAVVGC